MTPIKAEPSLQILGLVAPAVWGTLKTGFPQDLPDDTIFVFASYSPEDFPLGHVFDRILTLNDTKIEDGTQAKIVAVTQQFSRPFPYVPRGWKTVCALHFTPEVPASILRLPLLEGWTCSPSVSLSSSKPV